MKSVRESFLAKCHARFNNSSENILVYNLFAIEIFQVLATHFNKINIISLCPHMGLSLL